MANANPTPLVVVFRRRLPLADSEKLADNTRGESIVGIVMQTVQRTFPTARVVSLSRDTTVSESLTLFFIRFDPAAESDLRRAIRHAEMNWDRARTCVFVTARELHERLSMELERYEVGNPERTPETIAAHLAFLCQLGFPGWFIAAHPPDPTKAPDESDEEYEN